MGNSRVAAIVGPFASGKTALLESILHTTGAIERKGTANDSNRIGDASQEAKNRQMSVEAVVANTNYLDDEWVFIDTPGSVEFLQDTYSTLMIADVAVVVVDPDPSRVVMTTPILKFLSQNSIPHLIFVNKVESKKAPIETVINSIKEISDIPLVVRQVPINKGEETQGYIALSSNRAYYFADGEYKDNKSNHKEIPSEFSDEVELGRQEMFEAVADFDDDFMEVVLEDGIPSMEEIYNVMKKAFQDGLVAPVFFGSGEQDYGIKRLLKALRHEAPTFEKTKQRLEITEDEACALVFKTVHAQHTGKQSISRVFAGEVADGAQMAGAKVSGLYTLFGEKSNKASKIDAGGLCAIGRLEEVNAGQKITASSAVDYENWVEPLQPMFSYALTSAKKGEEVKLSGAIAKLLDEDPSLTIEHNQDTGEMLLWGQGEIHLKVAQANLKGRFNVSVDAKRPTVPYKETIKGKVQQQGRHKKQSGGAGQFGDVHVEIKPLPRGEGFQFTNTIVGGAVPKNYIPAVEAGCREYIKKGPLGFNVVDVAVNLYDGSYHAVDSSDQAFKMAGILAMREGLPKCKPTLLEPILAVEVSIPTEWTSGAQRALSQRRGQILGFEQKPGWQGWDVLKGFIPQSEMHDLIIELRSLTMGVGTFSWEFDHLQELTGKDADIVIEARKEALEA